MNTGKIRFQNNEFDTFHEATCAALFNKYGWRWEQQMHPLGGWLPDFVLQGHTTVYVEYKGSLKWDDVRRFSELVKYEDAIYGSRAEALLIPKVPRRVKNPRGYETSVLGFLYDGDKWSYAELGRWSGKVGFCHSAHNWRDRMSGEDAKKSSGDGQSPNIDVDWRSAESIVKGKKVSFFQGFNNSDVEMWESSEGSSR